MPCARESPTSGVKVQQVAPKETAMPLSLIVLVLSFIAAVALPFIEYFNTSYMSFPL